MDFLTDELLNKVQKGKVEAILEMDHHGLIIGPDETPKDFADRIRSLRRNIQKLELELVESGKMEVDGITLKPENAIPQSAFEEGATDTKRLFGFAIDWVPGFFTNDRMGMLFAGCALYSYEDFFAVFLIRQAFKKSKRWWIYNRSELMAHELTHIAHIGFQTPNFEEYFAFQTSVSGFRRVIGGVFRSPKDTYILIAAMFSLLLVQLGNVVFRAPDDVWKMPTPLFFGAAFAAVFWIVLCYLKNRRRFNKAIKNLRTVFDDENALPVLFRCSEEEIAELGSLRGDNLRTWLENRKSESIRWKVICRKFGK